ncbi:MAG: response regulator [Calditrichaeota bacterium]|nr:response regulator [Calditrichota bacterium]
MISPKILIIDEESIIALEIKANLESFGFKRIQIVRNSNQALEKIKHYQPDLVLTEIFFSSGLDGIDIVKSIRKQFPIDVIFVTGLTFMTDDPQVKKIKPLALVAKPFVIDELIEIIQSKYPVTKP